METKEYILYPESKESLISLLKGKFYETVINENPGHKISNSKIRRLLVSGNVFVNDTRIKIPGYVVRRGDRIRIFFDQEKFEFEKSPDDIPFTLENRDVIYEDEYLIAVNKPPCFPTEAVIVKDRNNLHYEVKNYLWKKSGQKNIPYAGVLHRLDRETSGVVVFSKNRNINKEMFDIFSNHNLTKKYLALSFAEKPGINKSFTVSGFMKRTSPKSRQCKWGLVPENRNGVEEKYSKTDFEILGFRNRTVLIRAVPLTGRTHQIRVHLASENLPILGDSLYGGKLKYGKTAVPRTMLHAEEISFTHPVTGEKLCLKANLPGDFKKLLKDAGL